MMNKKVHAGMLIIDLAFTAVLFYIGYNVLTGNQALFGLDGPVNTALGIVALLLAGMGLVRSFRGVQQLIGDGPEPAGEDVPEYGYQDEWERKNL
ncbi:hypothetical protein AArc1_5015 (plasmid) [Natrarchaeobaculum sulfurireducens]|uniref:Uncharacterized protein n=2 Tax=Natrarchaeobaculum sulfurireducens TaxID=2044521 RepID=A0A346P9M1_9EURY|nr:hypothetical protein AArc1_5015 [Natrarchaeobaculum sulfurireducens]